MALDAFLPHAHCMRAPIRPPVAAVRISRGAPRGARVRTDTMPMEGDIYTFFLSIILVAALLFWARDLGEEEPQTQKKKKKKKKTTKALKLALQKKTQSGRDVNP